MDWAWWREAAGWAAFAAAAYLVGIGLFYPCKHKHTEDDR